ncbi:DMT family transporter [uncultured Clostridium sp.]|uniref:DMT family transporter n=1 Tax=uncultured Clostridium sp. TaxID=59620 RepID=UPI002623F29F|nr:DMT family transporter [uncultured Clostridium sp.]
MKKYIFLILISTFLFSTMEIAIKCTGTAFNSIQLNFIRFLIGGLVLLPLSIRKLRKNNRKLQGKDFIYFLITGFICIIISMTLFTAAVVMKGSNPAVIAVIFSFNPIFTIALASIIFKEKITKGIIGGLVVCFIGLLFVINPFQLGGSAVPSMIMALVSGFTFALYSIMSKYTIVKRKLDAITVTAFTFLVGSFELLILIGLSHIKAFSNLMVEHNLSMFSNIPILHGISMHNIILLLYISIFVSGISFALLFIVMEKLGATMSSLIFFIKPVLSPILALILIHDVSILYPHNYVGVIFMAIGSIIIFIIQMKMSKNLIKR